MSLQTKKSQSGVEAAKETWTKNLKSQTKRRPDIPEQKFDLSDKMCKMPSSRVIVGRYLGLFEELKGRKDRIAKISEELTKLWEKLNFPAVSKQQVNAKVEKIISLFEKDRKRSNEEFKNILNKLFDITKVQGNWLSGEDKKLYQQQITTGGRVGYTTMKQAPSSSMHPSKRIKISSEPSDSQAILLHSSSSDTSEEVISSQDELESLLDHPVTKRTRQPTKSAAKLVSKHSLSTRKASKVLQSLSEEGVSLATPSQSGIWRRTIKDAQHVKHRITELISQEQFCLHFDGKRIDNNEYQVVCLQSPQRALRLGILSCTSGSAENIFAPLKALLDEYQAWINIKMIISDTTAVNTGSKSGIVVRLQKTFTEYGLEEPQFIGCQNHILDLILRHILDFYFPIKSKSPNINYKFIDEINEGYLNLQQSYLGAAVIPVRENPGWRDDFKQLFELCEAFRYHQLEGVWPLVKWHRLPPLHSARWNSRAIYALIAYFLLPDWRKQLEVPCNFIANTWCKAWFSNQHYKENIYEDLHQALLNLECAKAVKCFSTHWKKEPSLLDVPRSNIVAERAVKLMEEVRATCKSDKYLNDKFINTNTEL